MPAGRASARAMPILRFGIISDIETEQAEVACKFAKMPICYKVFSAGGLQSIFLDIRARRLHRIYFNICVPFERIIKFDGPPVNQD